MVVGVLYEGGLDIEPLQEIISVTACECGYLLPITYELYPASAQTLPKFKAAATKFSQSKVDVFITHVDTDGDATRRTTYRNLLGEHRELLINMKSIALFVDPHFEVCFIEEESALKNFFTFPNDQPLPYAELRPKARVQNMIKRDLPDECESWRDSVIYAEITKRMNLDTLARKNTDFENFRRELIQVFSS